MNRKHNALTDARIKALTGTDAGRHSDGGNLYLNVTNTGAKSWLFLYRSKLTGTRRELGLGPYFLISLKEARAERDNLNSRLFREPGFDPVAERLAARGIVIAARKVAAKCSVAFRVIMEETIAHEEVNWAPAQAGEWRRSLGKLTKLLDAPIGDVDGALLYTVMKPVWDATAYSAERLRQRVERIIDFAIQTDRFTGTNPAIYDKRWEINVGRRVGAEKKSKQPSLPYAELPAVFAKLVEPSATVTSLATAFCALTAVRTANTRLATWAEIDLQKKLWVIPADKMKVDERDGVAVNHEVPLSDAAVEILERVKGMHPTMVFPGKGEGDTLNVNALNDRLTKPSAKSGLGLAGKASMHGMRATFRTWANEETHFAEQDLEFALAHVTTGVVGAYQRGTSTEKRRPIMQAWADFAAGKIAAGALLDNSAVVPFERKAA